jgi:hypothetical protein
MIIQKNFPNYYHKINPKPTDCFLINNWEEGLAIMIPKGVAK